MGEYTVTGPAHAVQHLDGGADPLLPAGGTSGQVLTIDSNGALSWATPTVYDVDPPSVNGGLISETYIRQTADVTRNNTSALAATDVTLIVPVTASGLYVMEWHLLLDSGGSAAADFKIDFGASFPASGSIEGYFTGPNGALTLDYQPIVNETDTTIIGLAADDDHMEHIVHTTYLAGGTAGNVTLQVAQNAATMVDTKLLAGSFVRVLKVKS